MWAFWGAVLSYSQLGANPGLLPTLDCDWVGAENSIQQLLGVKLRFGWLWRWARWAGIVVGATYGPGDWRRAGMRVGATLWPVLGLVIGHGAETGVGNCNITRNSSNGKMGSNSINGYWITLQHYITII